MNECLNIENYNEINAKDYNRLMVYRYLLHPDECYYMKLKIEF